MEEIIMKKRFKRMLLICIFIILILTISIIVLKTNNKTENTNETNEIVEGHLGLTENIVSETNVEYKNITKLNTLTGSLLNSTRFISDFKDFIIYDMQDCINTTSSDSINDYYDSNSDVFNRELFTVSESSFKNVYSYLLNLKQSIADSCTGCNFSEIDDSSVKISLTFTVDNKTGILEGTIKKNINDVLEVIF